MALYLGNNKVSMSSVLATSTGTDGEVVTTEEKFKVWGDQATSPAENDIVLSKRNGFYDKTGKLVATDSFCSNTDLIEITSDTIIYGKYLYDFSAGYAISFFDANKSIISGIGGTGNTSVRITGYQTIPAGTKYVGVSLLSQDPAMYVEFTIRKTTIVNPLKDRVAALEEKNSILESDFSDSIDLSYNTLSNSIDSGYIDTTGVFQSSSGWKTTEFFPINENDKLEVKLATYNTVSAISFFDVSKNFISGIVGETLDWSTSIYPLTGQQVIPKDAKFVKFSIFINNSANAQYVKITYAITKRAKNLININPQKDLNVLVLGDSYSAMGNWIRGMMEVINVKSLVNLGVTSATIKDRQADRTTYPYSDRPTSTGTGNINTLASQIQKLKRLMKGTDLDSGEKKIYESSSDYPDVIIIEGGMNDGPDSDTKVNSYYEQFLVSKSAYYKKNSSSTATQTTVYVKPSLDTIDRTCFAGAYRYICEELLTLFPSAQIFLTTASHMNYFENDPNQVYGKIAEQQRLCANIMSFSVIDWHAEGNLNTILIGLKGSGTASDPYTPVGGDTYTTDLLHPNALGGKRYGRLAGKVIQEKFLNLS